MPGRKYSAGTGYRYGFNGKENDNEVKGEGNQQDYGMRIYDPRIGRFLSVDPMTKSYPMLTSYQFSSNDPIESIDVDGTERLDYRVIKNPNGTTELKKIGESPTTEHSFANTVSIPTHLRVEYNGNYYLFIGNGPNSDLAQGKALPVASKYNSNGPYYYMRELTDLLTDPDKFASSHASTPKIDFHDWYVAEQKIEIFKLAVETTIAITGAVYQKATTSVSNNLTKQTTAATGSPSAARSSAAATAKTTSTTTDAPATSTPSVSPTNQTANTKNSTLNPGPHARRSIPATNSSKVFTAEEREAVNEIGNESGCHTCGANTPGTKSGNWIPDHQTPSALNPNGKPQVLLPHCIGCSRKQGGEVNAEKQKNNRNLQR